MHNYNSKQLYSEKISRIIIVKKAKQDKKARSVCLIIEKTLNSN